MYNLSGFKQKNVGNSEQINGEAIYYYVWPSANLLPSSSSSITHQGQHYVTHFYDLDPVCECGRAGTLPSTNTGQTTLVGEGKHRPHLLGFISFGYTHGERRNLKERDLPLPPLSTPPTIQSSMQGGMSQALVVTQIQTLPITRWRRRSFGGGNGSYSRPSASLLFHQGSFGWFSPFQ